MGKTIGIDLGTTNSAAAVVTINGPEIIPNAEGNRTTPSTIAYAKGSDEVMVGELARRQYVTNIDRTFSSVKEHMGSSWKSPAIDGKNLSPQEISARVLQKLKRDAEAYLGEEVDSAVITVPAYFNDAQRNATKEAGEIAGLTVKRVINEPTAAALAYGLDKAGDDETIIVYDLGGGTFDVSVLEVGKDEDGFATVQTISTSGDVNLGGDDFDKIVSEHIIKHVAASNPGVDITKEPAGVQRIREAAEQVKKDLSASSEAHVSLPYLTMFEGAPVNVDMKITRPEFDTLTKELVERTRIPFEKALKDAKLTVKDITTVILVGGSTRIPAVYEFVKKLTGKEPNKTVNPDEVVALGAALQGAIINGEVDNVLLIDVTSLSLGLRVAGDLNEVLIPNNTAIPTSKTETFTTSADGQRAVTILVTQGERQFASDNHKLGEFDLKVAPAPAGKAKIEVSFDIDANGIVSVKATDTATGKTEQVVINSVGSLSDEDIKRMVEDGKANEASDKARRELIEIRNAVPVIIASAKEDLDSYGEQLSAGLVSEITAAIGALESEAASETATAVSITAVNEKLVETLTKIGEELYANNDTAEEAPADTTSVENNEEIIETEEVYDAEIVE